MRNILFCAFLLLSIKTYCQIDFDKVVYVGNEKNFEKSIFSKLKLKKNVTAYTFNTTAYNLSLNKFDDIGNKVSKITNIPDDCLTTALGFFLNNNFRELYLFPINDRKFDYNYFRNKIGQINDSFKVRISTTIYKTNSTPIVVIDNIDLMKL